MQHRSTGVILVNVTLEENSRGQNQASAVTFTIFQRLAQNSCCKMTYGLNPRLCKWFESFISNRSIKIMGISGNLVNFNQAKTQCWLISKSANRNIPDSSTLEFCDKISMLGVTLEHDLSWNVQITCAASKSCCMLSLAFFSGTCAILRPLTSYAMQGSDSLLSWK